MTTPRVGRARARVVDRITDYLTSRRLGHPLRVAVDGITAAGKTTLAAELTASVEARGRPAIHLSMDGFHYPRAHRYRQGRSSAIGYYEDAYDVATFGRLVLDPLGPDGDRFYRRAILDLATDSPVDAPPRQAETDAVLLVDGTFLQRPELAGRWDEVLYVDTDFEVALTRAVQRDTALFGGAAATEQAYRTRYHPACRLYIAEIDPLARATVVVRNDDIVHPTLRRVGDAGAPAARIGA